jgi:hypothetical protein
MRVSCDVSPNTLAQSHMDPTSCGIAPTYWRSRAPEASGARRFDAHVPRFASLFVATFALGNETLKGRAEGGLERETGFEPATSCLEGRCSTN